MQVSIEKLKSRESLTEAEMVEVMREIMSGKVSEFDMISFLTLLRDKGETLPEILGAVRVMREFAVYADVPRDFLVDTCGTGGDGRGTFNISTAAAFVAAAAGVRVAKHGNRSVSSPSGSADILEALGVKIDLPLDKVRDCLASTGFAFLFAPNFHPAMRYVAGARKKMGTRTIFNLLGPMTNPADPPSQVIGVYDPSRMIVMAEVMRTLGSRHVLFVHGDDGLDEITLTAKTKTVELKDGQITEGEIDPISLGLELCRPEELSGRDAAYNAVFLKGLLEGYDCPLRHAVLLNAAAALYVTGRARHLEEGIVLGEHAMDQGKAYQVLKDVIKVTHG